MILNIYDRFKVRRVDFFSNFQLSLSYDSFGSTFSFEFYYDPDNPDHKELACVSHYHDCTLEHNGEILVTGFALSQGFEYDPTKKLATIAGYSKPGIFEDCEIPPELYPLQSNSLTLKQVAEKLISPWREKHKIDLIVSPSVSDRVNKVYKSTTAGETTTISSYLTELAQQKQVVVSHDNKGNLLLTEAMTESEPIINFDWTQGLSPATSFRFQFNGQGIHSHITVQRQASTDGGNAGSATVRNPYCPVLYRPTVKSQTSGDDIDTTESAMRELGKELKDNISLAIDMDSWEWDGKLLRPNNMITLIAPELFIFTKSRWFIRSVDFTGNAERTTTTLNCVLPESYNGKMPVSIFKGINMHP